MINVRMPDEDTQLKPRITVIGVGGGGSNAVNNMIQTSLEGVEFLVCNTDAQSLQKSLADRKIQMGTNITRGLGAGARPDVGRAAAEESLDDIMGYLDGANMAFITAGMGGGSGSGAAPVIARAAREAGILTVGVVTKPFHFEGQHRMRIAEAAIEELQQYVDTLLIIPNQNLFRVANEKTTFADAFKMADDVLNSGVRGVTDLMIMPGLINLDFADIRTVMAEMGKAMMGTGEASGENRAIEAAESAISNPLLEDTTMQGARGVLVNITGGYDMTLFEVDEACNRIRDEVDPNANIIFGSTFAEEMEGCMRVSVVATGIESEHKRQTTGEGYTRTDAISPQARPANIGQAQTQTSTTAEPQRRQAGGFGGIRGFGSNNTTANSGNASTTSQMQQQSSYQNRVTAPAASTQQQPISAARVSSEMTTARTQTQQQPSYAGNVAHKVEQQPMAQVQFVEELELELDVLVENEENNYAENPASEDSFIPPAPVAVNKKERDNNAGASYASHSSIAAEPASRSVASSVMEQNEAAAPKKSMSLFERLTGARTETKIEAAPEPTISVRASREEPQNSDDDLDIPAFLRRQVN